MSTDIVVKETQIVSANFNPRTRVWAILLDDVAFNDHPFFSMLQHPSVLCVRRDTFTRGRWNVESADPNTPRPQGATPTEALKAALPLSRLPKLPPLPQVLTLPPLPVIK